MQLPQAGLFGPNAWKSLHMVHIDTAHRTGSSFNHHTFGMCTCQYSMVAMQAAQPALFVRASDGLREHQVGKRGGTASMQTAYYEHCGHQYEYCEHETRTRARARASTAAACTCRCAAAAFGDLEQSLSSSQVSCGVVLPVIELYTLGASVSTRSLHGPVKFFSSVQTCLYGTTSVRP